MKKLSFIFLLFVFLVFCKNTFAITLNDIDFELIVTPRNNSVHIEVVYINVSTAFNICFSNSSNHCGLLILGPDEYDEHNGHTVYKPADLYSNQVQISAPNVTTGWLDLL